MKYSAIVKDNERTVIHEADVYVEASDYEQALEQAESDYWENPNGYVLEPRDTKFEVYDS